MKIRNKNKKYNEKWDEIMKRRNPKLYKETMKKREEADKKAGQKLFLKEIYKRGERIG